VSAVGDARKRREEDLNPGWSHIGFVSCADMDVIAAKWQDRAEAAEADLDDLRAGVRKIAANLRQVSLGEVSFDEVARELEDLIE
jgi:predicted neutral ceramidase superfamily lipid hydrolase